MHRLTLIAPAAVVLSLTFGGAAVAAPGHERARAATITSVSFTMSGYANLVRDVPRYQLGQVYLDGRGTVSTGTSVFDAGTQTRNAYLYYPEATMTTQVIGWSYSAAAHGGRQKLVLTVKVVSSNDPVDCEVGTLGEVTLIDDNRRMANDQRRDAITQIYPVPGCPSFVQGVSNRDAGHLQPTSGGPGGGQWAKVTITASTS